MSCSYIVTCYSYLSSEFLAKEANCPINIDSRIMAITKSKIENPDRYTYDEARVSLLIYKNYYSEYKESKSFFYSYRSIFLI